MALRTEDPTSVDADRRQSLATAAFFAALFGVALLSRFWALGRWSLWGDEQYTWFAANLSLHDMWFWTGHDLHPPLYYAIMHVWVGLAGDSTNALRAPSAIASALTVPVTAYAAWKIAGRWAATIAAVLLILNPSELQFAQEARMYPLAGLFSIVSVVALAKLLERPALLTWLLYTAAVVALIYTHYVGFLVVGVQVLVLALYGAFELGRRRRPTLLVAGASSMLVAAVCYAPWWQYFFDSASRGAIPSDVQPLTWLNVAFNFRDALGLERSDGTWPFFAIVLAGLGCWALWRHRQHKMSIAVFGLAVVPLAEIAVSLVANPVFDLKRMSPFIPALSIVSALALVRAGELAARALRVNRSNAVALAVFPSVILATFMFLGSTDKYAASGPADWRHVNAMLDGTKDPTYVWPAYNVQMLSYFTRNAADLRFTDRNEFLAAFDGFMPLTRTWPQNGSALVFEFTRPQDAQLRPVLNGLLSKYFVIDSTKVFPRAIAVSHLQARSISQYNVDLVSPETAWVASSDGWATTTAAGSRFRTRFPMDLNRDGGVEAAFAIHLEYRSAAPVSVSGTRVDGTPVRLPSSDAAIGDGWRVMDVSVAQGAPITNEFALDGEAEFRTIEIRRYDSVGATAGRRDVDSGGDWFVRPDGYIEPIISSACVTPAAGMPNTLNLTVSYLSGFSWMETTVPATITNGVVCSSMITARMIVRSITLSPR